MAESPTNSAPHPGPSRPAEAGQVTKERKNLCSVAAKVFEGIEFRFAKHESGSPFFDFPSSINLALRLAVLAHLVVSPGDFFVVEA